MTFLASAFKIFRIICCVYAIYLFIFWLDYRAEKKKTRDTPEADTEIGKHFYKICSSKIRVIILLILSILFTPPVFELFQNTNIGSFLEEDSYRECYYVYIRENKAHAKSYKVKADIIRGYLDTTNTDVTLGDETLALKDTGYFVEKIYWSNGGCLTFYIDDLEYSSARIYPGIETEVIDMNDNVYYVTLTKEKVK